MWRSAGDGFILETCDDKYICYFRFPPPLSLRFVQKYLQTVLID